MSKKKRTSKKAHRRGTRASVASAYRSTLGGGSYGAAIAAKAARQAERALGAKFGEIMMHRMHPELARVQGPRRPPPKPKRRRLRETKKGRADAASNLALITARGGLYGPIRPGKPRKPRAKKVPTVSAQAVVNQAQTAALKRWVCEGARRSGCGAGGTRVINAKGSFVRLRPFPALTRAKT